MTHYPIAIVGGGPAGIACAVQLYHAGLRPLLIERDQLGGLLRSANWVENYPGFPMGIKGSDLAQLFAQQFLRFEPELLFAGVTNVDWDGCMFRLESAAGGITADTLVIATGTVPKPMPAFCKKPELKSRIYSEIIPLLGEKDKTIAIVGGSDAAYDYALSLAAANDVIILNRQRNPRCLEILRHKVDSQKNIRCCHNTVINTAELVADDGIRLAWIESKIKRESVVDYVLLAIGREPNLDLLNPELKLNCMPLLENDSLILIGDVINEDVRQTAISVGQGVLAAISITKRLRRHANP